MFDFFKNNKTPPEKIAAIVVAAGQSSRMGGVNKQFIEVLDKPILAYSLEALENSENIDEIIVVTREQDIVTVSDIAREFDISKVTSIVVGGETRGQSVQIGLFNATDADIVVIHDGARPCVLTEDIDRVIEAAKVHGGAALGCPVNDTLKTVNADGIIIGTVDRAGLWQVQTPQVFRKDIIEAAYRQWGRFSLSGVENNGQEKDDNENRPHCPTDDCMLVESVGGTVCMVEGSPTNIKVTKNDDIYIVMAIIQSRDE